MSDSAYLVLSFLLIVLFFPPLCVFSPHCIVFFFFVICVEVRMSPLFIKGYSGVKVGRH